MDATDEGGTDEDPPLPFYPYLKHPHHPRMHITPRRESTPDAHHPQMRITPRCASTLDAGYPRMRITPVWSGLVWSGLVWSGLVWSGLVWSGHMLSENMWFLWFKTSLSGKNVGCDVCTHTHGNVKIGLESCRIRNWETYHQLSQNEFTRDSVACPW